MEGIIGSEKMIKNRGRLFALPLTALLFLFCGFREQTLQAGENFGMVLHGGAGAIRKGSMTGELESRYRAKLTQALQNGYDILKKGGSSLDAVTGALVILEDSPLFNAGKGAVFTNTGSNELDASIMEGRTLQAGAVAGVKTVKNPILLARKVMESSPHVLLSGDGADSFARDQGLEIVDPGYFYTEKRWKDLQKARARETGNDSEAPLEKEKKHGTVGAAALDRKGNLAAGTSTGGMTNKRFGRIGDSPLIGAGTYADNDTCAISATGHGEYFIRAVVAHDISALMQYKGLSLQEAARKVILDKLTAMGGTGGIVAIDKDGNVAMPFNTEGMYRGWVDRKGKITVKIYRKD